MGFFYSSSERDFALIGDTTEAKVDLEHSQVHRSQCIEHVVVFGIEQVHGGIEGMRAARCMTNPCDTSFDARYNDRIPALIQ